ncbi:MAG TPA: chromosome segregation protein SMC, partial [Oscillospiraceae bacterium]|nr:chromosome segregation protein SMC [Oscillospiraceae bacterium]
MYLKALEIQGFKSFPDKTTVQFGEAVSAIVGPNGSGKSNIADAIRWVLGEQSTRALRGGKMEDVIFGGTAKRAQVGFAQVSLILDNTDRALPLEESEAMITRRYYRSGESEYYINRRSVRLKDVNELFMDTGLGREGYSIIGQGKIDEILSVRSADRREIFEEAAGISKFRYRKEEAERKLQRTEENLLRVNDKIAELELQVEPLREQAARAKKYLILRDEMRGLEVTLWLEQLDKLRAAARKAETDFGAAAREKEETQNLLSSLYTASERAAEAMRGKDTEAESLRGEIAEKEAREAEIDNAIAVCTANIQNNEQNAARVREELSAQEGREGSVAAQLEARRERLREIEARAEALASELEELLRAAAAAAESAGGLERSAEALRAKEALLAAAAADEKAALSALAATGQELCDRENALEQERSSLAAEAETLRVKKDAAEASLAGAREERDSVENVINGYRLRLAGREKRAERAGEAQRKLQMDGSALESRLHLLTEMEKSYEGHSGAVRVVMREAKRGALRGVRGPVAALLKTPDAYTVAVEVALGGALGNVVVETEEDGKRAIGALKRLEAGRATFLPMTNIRARRLNEAGVEKEPGFVGLASDLVSFDEDYRGVFENLLGTTVVAEHLDAAAAVAKKYGYRFRVVTLDGQVMNRGGSMTGGSANRSAGILSRANELERLTGQQKRMAEQLAAAASEAASAARERDAAAYELEVAEGQKRQAEDRILKLEAETEHLSLLLESARARRTACGEELAALQSRAAQMDGEAARLRESLRGRDEETAALRKEAQELIAGRGEAQERSGKILEDVALRKTEEASLAAERAAIGKNIEELAALRQSFSDDRERRLGNIEDYAARKRGIEAQILEEEEKRAAVRGEKETLRRRLAALGEERLALEGERTRADREAQEKNKLLLDMERACALLEQKKLSAALEEKAILDKLWDTYELSHAAARSVRREVESLAKAGRRVAELKRAIAALGTPNIGAIDEFERVNTRYEYLTSQRDDAE